MVSSAAGALEPCGCVKDMLGGVDHAASYLDAQGTMPLLALGSGPLLFMDPELTADRRTQDLWKAEALARSFRAMNLRAWAPGANDFAAGGAELARLVAGGPAPFAANLKLAGAPLTPSALFSVGGIQVGVAGISVPKHRGKLPEAVDSEDPLPAAQREAAALQAKGAKLLVLLAALPRGEALRLIEAVPAFQIALLGKPADQGEMNDPPLPPSSVGKTLVVEAPNHLQSLYVVDLFVKNDSFEFANADARAEEREELTLRAAELSRRIDEAAKNSQVSSEDLAARRQDLTALRGRISGLGDGGTPPSGSYYRASRVEVRESLGADKRVAGILGDYYQRVNEHNRQAFQSEKPAPAPASGSSYVGVAACATCHQEEYAFWQKTRHANAYFTLSKQHKEFNLDCVGCHVTGYRAPGGSTVAHVENLKDVQCEVCHGPGSRHVASPSDDSLLLGKPDRALCAPKCHHPPHVKEDWDVAHAFEKIIGPGHGR